MQTLQETRDKNTVRIIPKKGHQFPVLLTSSYHFIKMMEVLLDMSKDHTSPGAKHSIQFGMLVLKCSDKNAMNIAGMNFSRLSDQQWGEWIAYIQSTLLLLKTYDLVEPTDDNHFFYGNMVEHLFGEISDVRDWTNLILEVNV